MSAKKKEEKDNVKDEQNETKQVADPPATSEQPAKVKGACSGTLHTRKRTWE